MLQLFLSFLKNCLSWFVFYDKIFWVKNGKIKKVQQEKIVFLYHNGNRFFSYGWGLFLFGDKI